MAMTVSRQQYDQYKVQISKSKNNTLSPPYAKPILSVWDEMKKERIHTRVYNDEEETVYLHSMCVMLKKEEEKNRNG